MNKIIIYFVFLYSCINGESVRKDYSNHSIFKITPKTPIQLVQLQQIEKNNTFKVDFLSHPYKIQEIVSVLVEPVDNHSFADFLNKQHIEYIVTKVELQSYQQTSNTRGASLTKFDLNNFNDYNTAINWVKDKAMKCKTCQLSTIGKSFEGRDMILIRIGAVGRKGIFIDANTHSREWITSASTLYLINLLTNETDTLGKYLTSKYTFHILPFANPDGYEYSRTVDRFWRKTTFVNKNSLCKGVDPNRNFPIGFGGAGGSKDPCDNSYSGLSPLSIPETKAVANYIEPIKKSLKAYVTMHSYAKLILLPWGCNYSIPADNGEVSRVGAVMQRSISQFSGANYQVIRASGLYLASGNSGDWAKSTGIKYSFGIEMGPFSFDPPASKIFSLSREMIGAVKGMVDAIPDL